jgi:hypothetical protein
MARNTSGKRAGAILALIAAIAALAGPSAASAASPKSAPAQANAVVYVSAPSIIASWAEEASWVEG